MPAENTALKELLCAHPLFSLVDEEKLRLLSAGSELFTLEEGNALYSAGTPAEAAFLIAVGKIVLADPENPEGTRTIPGGELVGEGVEGNRHRGGL